MSRSNQLNLPPPPAGQEVFWSSGRSRLFKGNCISILEKHRKSSVDLIFADPPYLLSNDGYTCKGGKRASVNKGKWDKSHGIEKDFEFHQNWITACERVLKENGSLWVSGTYHSIYSCGFALQKLGWHIVNDICWYKPNAAPNLACRMFTASHETLIWAKKKKEAKQIFHYKEMKEGSFPKDKIKKEGKQMRSIWQISTPSKSEKEFGKHPTQKPLLLLERIIKACTNKNQIVLDPFCGSGTTGFVSQMLERRFIGIDKERKYLNLTKKRLKEKVV